MGSCGVNKQLVGKFEISIVDKLTKPCSSVAASPVEKHSNLGLEYITSNPVAAAHTDVKTNN